jgi:hypothetical protein
MTVTMERAMSAAEDLTKQEIIPEARYTPAEAAALLGFGSRPKTIHEIPDNELPRYRIGPRKGKVLFQGIDLLQYLESRKSRTTDWGRRR